MQVSMEAGARLFKMALTCGDSYVRFMMHHLMMIMMGDDEDNDDSECLASE